ncbi:MAG: EAL domain-containing protein, partial [Gammaproteobacteria bacterium]|nr:EAL domain-containing protein [Gammaproteobacteria bacterium]
GSLLMKADVAMYKAKEKKGSTFTFFDQSLNDATEQRARIESRLRKAISEEILQVYFQPKLHLQSGQIHHVEGLLRWPEANGNFVPPNEFIPVAEDTGLVHTFTNVLVSESARCITEVRRSGLRLDRVAINISTQQFIREKFADEFLDAVARTSIKTEDMEIEITESLFIENAEHVTRQLRKLQSAGVHIALDDFGTGFSSLNMLRSLPLNTVKIDRSFVTPMMTSRQARGLAEKIIEIAATLELEVVAEGVEQDAEMDLLRRFGCDYIQGFLLTQALPIDQLVIFLEQHRERLCPDSDVVPIRS